MNVATKLLAVTAVASSVAVDAANAQSINKGGWDTLWIIECLRQNPCRGSVCPDPYPAKTRYVFAYNWNDNDFIALCNSGGQVFGEKHLGEAETLEKYAQDDDRIWIGNLDKNFGNFNDHPEEEWIANYQNYKDGTWSQKYRCWKVTRSAKSVNALGGTTWANGRLYCGKW